MGNEKLIKFILFILMKNTILTFMPKKTSFEINDTLNITSLLNKTISLESPTAEFNGNINYNSHYINKLYYMTSLTMQNKNDNKTVILNTNTNTNINLEINNDYIILPKSIFDFFSSFLNLCECKLFSNIFSNQNFYGIICYNTSNLPNIIINLKDNYKIIFTNDSYIKTSFKNNKIAYMSKIIIKDYNNNINNNKNKKIILSESSSENYPIKPWIVILIVLGFLVIIAGIIVVVIVFYLNDQQRNIRMSMSNNNMYNNYNYYYNNNNKYSKNNVRNINKMANNRNSFGDEEQNNDIKNKMYNSQYNIDNKENITSPKKSKIININVNKSKDYENDIPSIGNDSINNEENDIPNAISTNNNYVNDNLNNTKNMNMNDPRNNANYSRQNLTNNNKYNYYQNNRNIELRPMQP